MIESTCWGQYFCSFFNEVLACPNDVIFLHYVLEYAIFLRLGLKKSEKPKLPSRKESPSAQLSRALSAKGLGPVPKEWKSTINEIFAPKDEESAYPHLELIEDLKKTKSQKARSVEGKNILTLADLHSIIEAWNRFYIKRPTKKELLTIKEYYKTFGKNPRGDPKPKFHDLDETRKGIRSWIMACRRKQAMLDKSGGRGVSSRDEEADENTEAQHATSGVNSKHTRVSKVADQDAALGRQLSIELGNEIIYISD